MTKKITTGFSPLYPPAFSDDIVPVAPKFWTCTCAKDGADNHLPQQGSVVCIWSITVVVLACNPVSILRNMSGGSVLHGRPVHGPGYAHAHSRGARVSLLVCASPYTTSACIRCESRNHFPMTHLNAGVDSFLQDAAIMCVCVSVRVSASDGAMHNPVFTQGD